MDRKNSLTYLYPALAFLVLFILNSRLATGQVSSAAPDKVMAPHKPVPHLLSKPLRFPFPAVSRSLIGGLWMTDANIKSALYLKNDLVTSPLEVTPILYLSNGKKIALDPIKLEPAGTATISINQSLAANDIAPYAQLSGYIEVDYKWPWNALSATVRNADVIHSLLFNYGLSLEIPATQRFHSDTTNETPSISGTSPKPMVIEGMWWKETKDVTGFIALSNPTMYPTEVMATVSDHLGQAFATHAVTILPHATKILNLEELGNLETGSGGISITYHGREGALLVHGGLEESTAGYSADIPFVSPGWDVSDVDVDQPAMYNIAELGLLSGAADPMMSFPPETSFTPYSVVRNTSEQSIPITSALYWMAGSESHSASLPKFLLLPHATISLDFPTMMAGAGLSNFNGSMNLVLSVPSSSLSALVIASGSVDKKKTYVFGVMPTVVTEDDGKVVSYWSTADRDDTMVTIWNPADEGQDFTFTLFYSGGHYALPLHLGPKNTRTFNISEIIQNQMPDSEGNIVPISVHEGSAQLSGSKGSAERILVAIDASTYNVQKATCGHWILNCSGPVASFITASPFGVSPGNTIQEALTDQRSDGRQFDKTASGVWSSSNPSVASVSAGRVAGYSLGTLNLNATFKDTIHGTFRFSEGEQVICPTQDFNPPPAPGKVISLQITSADIVGDVLAVTLSGPSDASGNLRLQVSGPNGQTPVQPINTGSALGPGSYRFSFQPDTIPIGEYTIVTASWTVNGNSATSSFNYHFKVLGTFRQTQYNTPAETQCTGSPLPITVWNPQCRGTNTNVISGFDFRVTDKVTGTGSGHSINWGDVQQEALCSVGSGDLRGFATIRGTLGSLSNSTVAACSTNPDVYVAGATVYIRGEGVKTVTDRCPACCNDVNHLDNYTTDTRCSGVPSLPSALTVRIY